jgi:hypothetical protein
MTLRRQISAQVASSTARLSAGWVDERRRVILHIGPHRTGTTTIQATLRASRSTAPDGIGMVTKKNETHLELSRLTHNISSLDAAHVNAGRIRAAASDVARNLMRHPMTIISDEDMLGSLPTRRRIRGLYPFVEDVLPYVLAGFRDEGVRVTVAWQLRDYADWMESVYHRRNDLAPDRPFDLAGFQRRHGLPTDWRDFERRLKRACAGVRVVRLSFEEDAACGMMGSGLFRLAGLSDVAIGGLKHSRARHSAPLRDTLARFSDD